MEFVKFLLIAQLKILKAYCNTSYNKTHDNSNSASVYDSIETRFVRVVRTNPGLTYCEVESIESIQLSTCYPRVSQWRRTRSPRNNKLL